MKYLCEFYSTDVLSFLLESILPFAKFENPITSYCSCADDEDDDDDVTAASATATTVAVAVKSHLAIGVLCLELNAFPI